MHIHFHTVSGAASIKQQNYLLERRNLVHQQQIAK